MPKPYNSAPCIVDGCNKRGEKRGMCQKHYLRRHKAQQPPCSVDGCDKRATAARGLCDKHYNEWRRQGEDDSTITLETCAADDCYRPIRALKLCAHHYDQLIRLRKKAKAEGRDPESVQYIELTPMRKYGKRPADAPVRGDNNRPRASVNTKWHNDFLYKRVPYEGNIKCRPPLWAMKPPPVINNDGWRDA